MKTGLPRPCSPTPSVGQDTDDSASTRWTLIGRLKNLDDQESWKEFFETYWRLILNVGLKAGLTHTEAEEVVQETVMSVCRSIAGFDPSPKSGSFKNWLLGVTRWRVLDQFRARKRLGPTDSAGSCDPDDTENGRASGGSRSSPTIVEHWEALWDAEWEQHVLNAALEKMKGRVSARHFQIFYLHVVKQEPVMEVARSLRVSPGRVYLVKHRVTKIFKKLVKEVEEGLSYLPRPS